MSFINTGNRIKFNATAAGLGDFVVSSAFTGSVTPEQASVIDGKTYSYYAQSADGSQWEGGSGTYAIATHKLLRTKINSTSNDNQIKINFLTVPIVDVLPTSQPMLEQNISKTISSINLNTITAAGTYVCSDTFCTNGPTAGGQWYIEVITYENNPTQYAMQRATSITGNGAEFSRTLVAGVWQPWQIILTQSLSFPIGTTMLFQQSAAPVGWTKITTFNDATLRVVSGTAGSGGSNTFSSVMAQTVVGSHSDSVGEMPSHSHNINIPLGTFSVFAPACCGTLFSTAPVATTTGSAGGGSSHNHSILMSVLYVDVILAQKN